ncbi:hypothetical protein L218DRAFT_1036068 [Marasmius fiardii PR-910]|nr:hypothetical protein L218DRAFT_1036068 [Marasmius fiardii PR-910]
MFYYRILAKGFRFELVVGKISNNPELAKSPKLATIGPYSIVCHPSYAGTCVNFIGSAMVHWWILETGMKSFGYAWLTGVGGGITVLLTRIGDEDALMKKQFGGQWDTWSKLMRYRLIPGVN